MGEFIELLSSLGNRIRNLRKEKGLSQEDFAFQCNLDRTYISGIELGKRNISIINLYIIANALGIDLHELLIGLSEKTIPENKYIVKESSTISCGFPVLSDDIFYAVVVTSYQLNELPFTLFKSVDLKTISAITGSLFVKNLAGKTGAIINPIEKGHPDIIPMSGINATEEQLRNYPEGLEIKCTIGNVSKESNLNIGEKRISSLENLTWQAHHREVERLLGLIIDFAGKVDNGKQFPIITAAFYADNLQTEDWGNISGTTGRNTKVTGMLSSGKSKMGSGWVTIIDDEEYKQKYGKILSFSIDDA